MHLLKLHLLLIAAGMALSALVVATAAVTYSRTHAPGTLGMGAMGAVMLVGLSLYLRWFARKRRGG